jgi:hypothetical protein
MPTYERAPKSVENLAAEILCENECYQALLDAKVTVDYLFAHADQDDDGNLVNDALKKNGVKALGVTRKTSLKQRALGLADAEISLDADWWEEASIPEQKALLDHELYHLELVITEDGLQKDDLGRPKLKLRHHDVDVGWFKTIAERHGIHSQERIQAKAILEDSGQYFWPELTLSHA